MSVSALQGVDRSGRDFDYLHIQLAWSPKDMLVSPISLLFMPNTLDMNDSGSLASMLACGIPAQKGEMEKLGGNGRQSRDLTYKYDGNNRKDHDRSSLANALVCLSD